MLFEITYLSSIIIIGIIFIVIINKNDFKKISTIFVSYLLLNVIAAYFYYFVLQIYTGFIYYQRIPIEEVFLYNLLFIIFLIIGYLIKRFKNNLNLSIKYAINIERIKSIILKSNLISILFFVVGSISINFNYGIFDVNDRGNIFLIGGGAFFGRIFLISNYLSIILSFYLLFYERIFSKKLILILFINILFNLLLGSKALLLLPLSIAILFLFIKNRLSKLKLSLFIAISFFVFISINVTRFQIDKSVLSLEVIQEQFGGLGSNIVNFGTELTFLGARYDYFYGEKMFFRPLLSLLPDPLWSFIGINSRELKILYDYRYSDAIGSDSGRRQGIVGDLYINFGIYGIIIGGFIIGLILRIIEFRLIKTDNINFLLYLSVGITFIFSINIDLGVGFFTRIINYALIPFIIMNYKKKIN